MLDATGFFHITLSVESKGKRPRVIPTHQTPIPLRKPSTSHERPKPQNKALKVSKKAKLRNIYI